MRDIIKQARHVGALANDAGIKNLCDELDKMLDRLTALKAQGLVSDGGFYRAGNNGGSTSNECLYSNNYDFPKSLQIPRK